MRLTDAGRGVRSNDCRDFLNLSPIISDEYRLPMYVGLECSALDSLGMGASDKMRARSDKLTNELVQPGGQKPMVEVGLLIYPRYHMAMVHGMTDVLHVASDFSVRRGGPPLRLTHWSMDSGGAIARSYDTHPGSDRCPDVLVAPALAPGALSCPLEGEEAAPFAKWLAERHAQGATLASTGCGTFVLAATGLLSGRSATTHWSVADKLQASFPDVKVDADKVLIDHGELLTAGGMMGWTDLCMRLIDRLLGPSVMVEAAQFWLIDPGGREQRHYSTFAPRFAHGDETILKLQRKLQAEPARLFTVTDMAREAGMEPRTFLRRFKAATGMKPTEYVQHLRISKAREHLQFTRDPLDQIAWKIGYGDVTAFRRLFRRLVGLSPGEYRRRFKANGSDALIAPSN
jgi:transcriptional regulator GlxA family with amidase domain